MPLDLILAAAGGGSSGFGGGGGGGGGFSGGSGGSGGSGSGLLAIVVLGGFVLMTALVVISMLRYRAKRRARVRVVELAAAEAAADDAAFAVDEVRRAADELFHAVQAAWTARDRAALGRLVGPDLLVEWTRRLDDFDAKGWHNVVEFDGSPSIEYVGLVNRTDDADDRAVVRIECSTRDFVAVRGGGQIFLNGRTGPHNLLQEYWTLAKTGGGWILYSIEQQEEGDHHLDGAIVATPWADTERLRDEAVAERAAAEAAPAGVSPAELADLDFDGAARAAAMDLALADGRFDPDLIEAAVRRAVAAWAEAVDGPDAPLQAVASPSAVTELLHPHGDRSRLVVRGARVLRTRIASLDAAAEPPAIVIELEVRGRRYVEDRDTAAVLEGNRDGATTFGERWTLTLDGPPEWPWRIASARSAAAA